MIKFVWRRFWQASLLGSVLTITFVCLAVGAATPPAEMGRSDLLQIILAASVKQDEMPPVSFKHDLHTSALEGEDCTKCHMKQDNRVIFKFNRIKDSSYEIDMAVYHDNCIGCHEHYAARHQPAGPVSGQCRQCHVARPHTASNWHPITFDRSLHYKHQQNTKIKAVSPEDDANCSACHHGYDAPNQKIIYEKGHEGSCSYCHTTAGKEPARPRRAAAHDACVACHLNESVQKQKTGPLDCAGCHDPVRQAEIERLQDVPRINAGQPDVALLATRFFSETPQNSSRNSAPKPTILPVAFDHKSHETTAVDCKTCHHASLGKCAKCHTIKGAKEGQYIRLEQAMHAAPATQSCIGCHQSAQSAKDCAGCHALLPPKQFEQKECQTCHRVPLEILERIPAGDADARTQAANTFIAQNVPGQLLPPDDQIPEIVTIGVMSKEYEPVQLPHRKIVRALADRVAHNRMATAFHRTPETLCMGCHHNGPVSPQPPTCASCHSLQKASSLEGRPGLKGAYHGQCISCHQAMGIAKPAATACKECHAKKG